MSHHTWNFNHQKQEQQVVEKEEEDNRYPRRHVHNQQNQNQVDPNPVSNKCEVAELTWENGQVAMHRLGSNLPNEQTKHTWEEAGDTLESIVHQATFQKQNHSNIMGSDGQNQANINRDKNAFYGCQQTRGVLKRMRSSDSDPQLYGGGITVELSAHASAKDNDIPMVTWPCNEDSACHGGSENKEEERETKSSNLSKRSRRAAVHNQSERRRRDRINEKMKALHKFVPNASKTDKASMLEEVIKYLKQLQAQVQLISNARNMEQQMMMMSLGMQLHIQMPLLARMGMCSTAGMLNNMTANLARAPYPSPLIYPTSSSIPTLCPPFMSPDFAVASSIPTPSQPNRDSISPTITKSAAAPNIATSSFPFNHPYNAFLPQSMKMEFNNEMAAQYLQQANQENVNIQGQKE